MMITIELTEHDAQVLADYLASASRPALQRARAAITPHLPVKPLLCPHTRSEQRCGTFTGERALSDHLVMAHNYTDDPYGEDTAQTNAWSAVQRWKL